MSKKYFFLILAFIFLLRLGGVTFGLPYDGIHPRENFTISQSIAYLAKRTFKPQDFQHPAFLQYLTAGISSFPVFIGLLRQTKFLTGESHRSLFYLSGRGVSFFASFFAVLVIFFCGRKLASKTGVFALLLAGFNFLAVKFAHYAVPDSLALLFVGLALLFSLRFLEKPKAKTLILAALFSGIALGSKFSGFIAFFYPLLAYLVVLSQKKAPLKFLFLLLFFWFLGFFLVSPAHVIFFKDALKDFSAYLTNRGYISSQMFSFKALGFYQYPFLYIPACFGLFNYIFFFFGCALLFKHERKKMLVVVLPLVFYFLLLGRENGATPRNVLLALPSLSLAGAYFFNWLYKKKFYKVLGLAVVLGIGLQGVKSIIFDYYLYQKDTRVLAQDWILKHIKKGAKIAFEAYTPYDLSHLTKSAVVKNYQSVYFFPSVSVNPVSFYKNRHFNYLVTSSFRQKEFSFNCRKYYRDCFLARNYAAFIPNFPLLAEFKPPRLFKLTAFPLPWGIWPHNPTVKIYKVK